MTSIRIGTRGSKLAMWQAEWVAAELTAHSHDVELIKISTKGDVSTQSLSVVGGQGVFTKEIQHSLLSDQVDVAVHSLKDLPTVTVPGLTLAAVPERETTSDCLISRTGQTFEQLPAGSRVGTGSARRGAQLLAWRKDVQIKDIRGNVDSRLRKLRDGQYDAIVLAGAGLTRLGLLDEVTEFLPVDRMLPAIGQGALGLECREDDETTCEALAELNHRPSFAAVTAERSLLAALGAGCMAPVAALGQVVQDELQLRARVVAVDGRALAEDEVQGPVAEAARLGDALAHSLLEDGAERLIAIARDSSNTE